MADVTEDLRIPSLAQVKELIENIDASSVVDSHNTDESAHNDIREQLNTLQTAVDGKSAAGHKHAASDITSGTLGVARGGTGATDAATARANLEITPANIGAAASSHGTHVTYSTTAPAAAGTASVGTATTVSRSDHVHPAQTTVSGNAGTATKLATARTVQTNLGSTSSASFDGSANVTPGVTGTLAVSNGGTGATTFTSGAALIGAGTSAVTTRSITNNTSATSAITGSTNLVTMNTLRYALNRTTAPSAADTSYTTAMVRAIQASTTDLTAGTSTLTNGTIYIVYE